MFRKTPFAWQVPATCLALFLACGCGKNPTAPTVVPGEKTLTDVQAREVAQSVGQTYAGASALDFARALFLPAHKPALNGLSSDRPARAARLTAEGDDFAYEIDAFDAQGNPVPWETTDWSLIERVVMRWNLAWDVPPDAQGSFSHGHFRGTYDITGLSPAASELRFSGSAADTLAYRFVWTGYDVSAHATWDEHDDRVRWSKDYVSNPYPLSGTETFRVDQHGVAIVGSDRETEDLTADVQLTFNGGVWADLTIDHRFNYKLNLDTGEVVSAGA